VTQAKSTLLHRRHCTRLLGAAAPAAAGAMRCASGAKQLRLGAASASICAASRSTLRTNACPAVSCASAGAAGGAAAAARAAAASLASTSAEAGSLGRALPTLSLNTVCRKSTARSGKPEWSAAGSVSSASASSSWRQARGRGASARRHFHAVHTRTGSQGPGAYLCAARL
jgi:hypothetical protein